MRKRLQEIADRWIQEVWQERNIDALDRLHPPDFIDHSPSGRGSDLASYRAGVEELFRAFPDFYGVSRDIVIDESESKAAILWTATGTHRGEFLGIEPCGKVIHFRGIEIITIRDDKITERWGEWDGIDILEQMGVRPPFSI